MKHLLSLIISVVICLLSVAESAAQTRSVQERISAINARVKGRVEGYRSQMERRYHQVIGQPWRHAEGEAPVQNPLDKPLPPADYDPARDEVEGQVMMNSSVLQNDGGRVEVADDEKIVREDKDGLNDRIIVIPCNGYEVSLRVPAVALPHLNGTSEKDISTVWEQMYDVPFDNLFHDLAKIREALKMGDWSFVRTVEAVSEVICTSSADAVLFQAYVLNDFGFMMCLARSADGMLYKMLSTDMDVIGYPLYHIDGHDYYLFADSSIKDIHFVNLSLSGERPMRMAMNPDEKFYPEYAAAKTYASDRYPEVVVSVRPDESRMAYYESYPLYFSGGDVLTSFYHHAVQPMSEGVCSSVYPVLRRAIEGKSEVDAVNILLNFVQTAFRYGYDDVVWGKERYFYADEIWGYEFSDCEDRSMLLSRLVKDLLGLEVALVYWPGHLSCAVRFNTAVAGAAFLADGKTYVSCDPTFIGAGVGAVMPDVKGKDAVLIKL